MKRSLSVFAVLAIALVLVFPVAGNAQTVVGSGSQYRGTGYGDNARLEGQPFTIPMPATITSAQSSGNGFWIQNVNGAVVASFWNANAAIGNVLAAGTYYVFPNLNQGQSSAYARVVFTFGGGPPVAPGGAAGLVWVTSSRWGVSIMVPAGWITRTDIAGDVAIQSMEPGENAFIRVHAASGSGMKLEELANRWEGRVSYSIRRTNEVVVNLNSGGHALVREYTGSYNGHPIGAGFLLTHTPGRYYIVESVYMQAASGLYANTLGQCMGTITP